MHLKQSAISTGCLLLCAAWVAGEGVESAALHAEVKALAAARDTLAKRLDERIAQDASGPAMEFALEFPDALAPGGPENKDRRGILMSVSVRGKGWSSGVCTTPRYNKAIHDVDASGLSMDDSRIKGSIRVTVNADAWVPSDGKSRALVIETDATVGDKRVEGSVRLSGDYGSYTGIVKGTWKALPAMEAAAGKVTPAPGADKDVAGLMEFATVAYQEARAAAICLANSSIAFSNALESTKLSPPCWGAIGDGTGAKEAMGYVRELRDLAAAAAEAKTQARHADGSLDSDDPGFGPVLENEPLPVEEGVSVLPDGAGEQAGGQKWQFVGLWDLLAVFPGDPLRTISAPSMPEVVFAPLAAYEPDVKRLGDDYERPKGVQFAWTTVRPVIPQVAPPGQRFHPVTSLGHHGKVSVEADVHKVKTGRWYGAATIRAKADCELHAAILADDFGKLWVNGRLVWMSRRLFQPYALFKLPLRKGDNRLILGCENERQDSAIALQICTRGAPMPTADRAALAKKTRDASLALPPLAVRGRHGDWTSRYPDADPPLAWDLKQRINIRWHVPLPDYSCASPVIAVDRVYVNCEPHSLYCLDKDTGAILWKRDVHVFEFVPEASRAVAMAAWDAAKNVVELPEVKTWDEQITAAESELRDDEESRKLKDNQREALEKKIEDLKKEREAFVRKSTGAASQWRRTLGVQEPGWYNCYGWTFGAPVADDKHVWVKYASGVAACFDNDGNRKWIVHTRLSGGVGNITSPVLLKNTFVIQGVGQPMEDKAEWDRVCAPWPGFYRHVMMGLDAETGKVKWVRPVFNTGAYGGATGIVPLRLSNGRITREIIINGDGMVIDPEDGRLLSDCRGAGASCWAGDPVVDGNRVYFGRGGGAGVVEFWLEEDGRVGSRKLFTTQGGGGSHGVVVFEGRCWGDVGKGSHGRHPVPWHQVSCADAETGKRVAELYPVLREGGIAYVPPAAAGGYMVASGNGSGPAGWSISPNESAQIGFVKADPEPWLATECKVHGEAMTAAPVFEGKRMYLRTYKSAMCIEVNGKVGRDLVFQAKAAELFQSVGERPLRSEMRTIEPAKDFALAEGVPVEKCVESRTAPRKWLFAGPVPLEAGDALVEAGGASNVMPKVGTALACGGQSYTFGPVADGHVEWSGGWSSNMYDQMVYSARVTVDVGGVAQRKQKTTTYLYSVIHTDKPRTVTPSVTGGSGTQAWLAGYPLKNDETLSLAPGYYPVLVKAVIQVLPPFVKKVGVVVAFKDVVNPNDAYEEWITKLKTKKARLEEVVRELPDSGEARTAASMLKFVAE